MPSPVNERNDFPLASIVINNYNYARFLGEAIDSALAQTYEPLEVIVVDDGSTDDSHSVITSHGSRVKPVFKQNGGMGSALNAGYVQCRGDIVLFLDSDDVLLPTAVENAAAILVDQSVAKVHWRMWDMIGDDRSTRSTTPTGKLATGDVREKLEREGPWAAGGTPTSANAWSRRFLERVMPMPADELRQHADAYLNTLAGLYGRLGVVAEPQGYYRLHGANDYAVAPRIHQLRRNMKMYHYRCQLLSEHLARLGTIVDPEVWKKGNRFFEWLASRIEIAELVEGLVDEGESYIFLDDGAWGNGELIPGRRRVPFADSRTGNGYPADDAAAVGDFEALRRSEPVALIVFVEPALWWLNSYPGLAEHLRSSFECIHESEHAIMFDVRGRQR